jgi:hypothetical protein
LLLQKIRFNRYVLLFGSLIAVTLLTALGGMLHYSHELDSQLISAKNAPIIKISTAPSSNKASSTNSSTSSGSAGTTTGKSSGTQQINASLSQQSPTQAPQYASPASTPSSPQPSTVQVTLAVNDQVKGVVALSSTSNQCDLLNQAYAQGILTELDMRYNSELKTYGIYRIDNIGDPNTVTWTYTVNGKPPQFGCSYIKVQNSETVNWQYLNN